MIEQLKRFEDLRVGDIISEVMPTRSEIDRKGMELFVYRLNIPETKGIIYPNDDYVQLGEIYRVIINKILARENGGILFSEVCHSDEELMNKEIMIGVSKFSHGREPMFRLRGHPAYYLGFVKNSKAEFGDILVIRTIGIKPGKIEEKILEAEEIAKINHKS